MPVGDFLLLPVGLFTFHFSVCLHTSVMLKGMGTQAPDSSRTAARM